MGKIEYVNFGGKNFLVEGNEKIGRRFVAQPNASFSPTKRLLEIRPPKEIERLSRSEEYREFLQDFSERMMYAVISNMDMIFEKSWKNAILVPNGMFSHNPNARSPAWAEGDIRAMFHFLGCTGIINRSYAVGSGLKVCISPRSPKRLDIEFTTSFLTELGSMHVDFRFGYFYGERG